MHSTKVLLSVAALVGTSLSQKSDSEFCSSASSYFFTVIGPPVTALRACHRAAIFASARVCDPRAELLSIGKEHSDYLKAFVTNCATDVASTTSYLDYIWTATNICETPKPTPGGASNGTYPTPTLTATSALNTSTSLIPTAAAARPTGALLGAAVAGGVLGVHRAKVTGSAMIEAAEVEGTLLPKRVLSGIGQFSNQISAGFSLSRLPTPTAQVKEKNTINKFLTLLDDESEGKMNLCGDHFSAADISFKVS
ncbi:hypothetical protein CHU98_g8486 [Xylaria longipes]|nr:hypothetical protein CHU98_g8486 [Xylaria longipes]